MNKSRLLSFSFILFFLINSIWAQINVLAPLEGKWANKQMLIISDSDEGEFYYSLNGSDPETFGFAYDGPVLIDLTGNVSVNITCIHPDGKKEKLKIDYSVFLDDGSGTDYENLVTSFYDSGIYNYTSGSQIEIPASLKYRLDGDKNPFIQGRNISLSEKNILSRYIPCTLSDDAKKIKYNFVIRTLPQYAGVFSRRDVPFTVTDWDKITFTSDKYIYKVDSEYWKSGDESRKLDRSVSHMISWQSIAYESGNPVEYFVLPPKPQISFVEEDEGSVVYSLDGDESYSMCILSSAKEYQELFSQIGIDSFYGTKEKGILELGIFSDSVYQGKIITEYNIDKCPPLPPQIVSDCQSEVSRKTVKIDVENDDKSSLYVKVIGPVSVQNPLTRISDIKADEEIYNTAVYINQTHFEFEPAKEGSAYYKVIAWKMQGENKSPENIYEIIIDQYNYFYNESALNSENTGSYNNPFTDFDSFIKGVNNGRSFCLWVTGDITVPSRNYSILSNCVIKSENQTTLNFNSESCICVKASTLQLEKINFALKDDNSIIKNGMKPLLKLENSVLDMKNCISSVNFSGNGTFIESNSSVLNITNCKISINSRLYTSFITALKKSRINVSDCIIGASGDTAVIFSVTDSQVNICKNQLMITCSLGRIAELFNAGGVLSDNSITEDIQKKTDSFSVIYKDKKTTVQDRGNEFNLF